mgnify:FL=1
MPEPTSPEEIEFHGEEARLTDLLKFYPEPVTFTIPSGGASALRIRLKRALKNYLANPLWTSSLDRKLAWKILSTYTFVADSKTSLYCGFPRRVRTPAVESFQFDLPVIRTENPDVILALLLLKNFDHIPIPVKIETALPIYELKEPYYNVAIADSIHENNYTII